MRNALHSYAHIELAAKLLDYFLREVIRASTINVQCIPFHMRNALHSYAHIELPAKLPDNFLRRNKSNINQCAMHSYEHTELESKATRIFLTK